MTTEALTRVDPSQFDTQRAAIRALDADARAADGHHSLGDSVWRDLAHPAPDSIGFLIESRAYAHVARAEGETRDSSWTVSVVQAPDARDHSVTTALLDAAVTHVGRRGGHDLTGWVFGATDDTDRAFAAAGFEPDRGLYEMRAPLPVPEAATWPPGIEVRAFDPDRDAGDWLRVNNLAFAGHAEQGGWDDATLRARMAEPWFDPALFLLAFDAGGLVGFNWLKQHDASGSDPALGEIYVIGVDPRTQGTGLGRALAIAGLDVVYAAGSVAAMLFVAADNVAAIALYRALGFSPHRTDRAYTPSDRAPGLTSRYGASRTELAATLEAWGEPRYRAAQLFDGLWTQRTPLDELTTLPKALRDRLDTELPLALAPLTMQTSADGETSKWLWQARDGAQVETVLMLSAERATVCVSSQAGCAMACTFCATGQAGFERHLDCAEIVEQVVRAQHSTTARVSHVVFMGMGEPLANVGPVCEALERLNTDLGLSARHLTVSTVGVVPGMRRLAQHPLPVTLAVSLHAPDDDLRATLVPLNQRYPIAAVLDAAREYAAIKGRRVTFEYACIAGVNDRPDQADHLARRLIGLRGGAHVNLIPLNPTGEFAGQPPDRERINRFASHLAGAGVTVTVRRNRGVDIDAACGQLRAREADVRAPGEPGPEADAKSARLVP